MTPRVGLNVHPDEQFRALLPLVLADDTMGALEWSWELGAAPWLTPLVDLFAAHDSLTTHLVQYPLSGDPARLESLLARVRTECVRRQPRLLTAHYGVVAAEGFSAIAPVPVVPTAAAAREAAERLDRLRGAAGCPVGVENLGIAFSADDVRRQAEMMHAILASDPEHFLLLDVHNLHCQAVNYGFAAEQILGLYPLDRVRELHVSGGSWWEAPGGAAFRRDTHDQAVPEAVFAMLALALRHCPRIEMVYLERMGGTMPTAEAREEVRADYRRVVETVDAAAQGTPLPLTAPRPLSEMPARGARAFESTFVAALCTAADPSAVRAEVSAAHPDRAAWLAALDERALHAAMTFERRWARRT